MSAPPDCLITRRLHRELRALLEHCTVHSFPSGLVDFLGFCCHIELEVDDVTIKDFIVTALLQVKTISFHLILRSPSVQIVELHDFGADEAALEVGVDNAGGTRSFRPLANRPALHLVLTRRKVMNQLECSIAHRHNLVDHGRGANLLSSSISGSLFWGASSCEHFRFKLGREWEHGASTVVSDPGLDLGQPLVLFTNVLISADVHKVDNGLGGHEEILVEHFDLLAVPSTVTNGLLLVEHHLNLIKHLHLLLIRLQVLSIDRALQVWLCLAKLLKVLLEELVRDDLHVTNRIHFSLIVHHLLVAEGAHHVVDAIDCLNVRQECIAKTLTFTGTCNKSSNIEDRDGGRHLGLGFVNVAKALKAAIRHVDLGLSRINRAEGVVLGGN